MQLSVVGARDWVLDLYLMAFPLVKDEHGSIIGNANRREVQWPPHRRRGTPGRLHKRIKPKAGTIHAANRVLGSST